MLTKFPILNLLGEFAKKYEIERRHIQVVGGAAMVIRDIRSITSDIDIYVSTKICLRLSASKKFEIKKVEENEDLIWLTNKNFDIRNTPHHCDLNMAGFQIQSVESLLHMKTGLNRDKDQLDIKLLRKSLAWSLK